MIQEPHVYKGKILGLDRELKVYRGKGKTKVRACIATTKDIEAWLITQYSNEDQTAIGIKVEGGVLVMASTYMPFDSAEPPPS